MATQLNPISEFVEHWRHGEPPNAQAVLQAHPELAGQKSLVLDLAYEEFCLRTESGERLAPSTFCNRFPSYRKSLQRLLGVHEYLARDSTHWSDDAGIAWPEPGAEFGGYELRAELGRGALARVFLAVQPALGGRLVALKLSKCGAQEAQILGKLAHDNIVPVYSVEQDAESGLTAICMPYLGAATLCDVLDLAFDEPPLPREARVILEAARRGPAGAVPAGAAVDRRLAGGSYVNGVLHLGIQLAQALALAHSKGVLHRDLKPSNILVTPDGRPMLLDFNLSFDPQVSQLRIGGTLPYAAPEQLQAIFPGAGGDDRDGQGVERVADARTDVYSLGVILYELLTGTLPFGDPLVDESLAAGITTHLAKQAAGAAPLSGRTPHVDRLVVETVHRCLRFDPAGRPQSAEELAGLLERCLAPRHRITRWTRQHRAAALAMAVAATAVLAGAGWIIGTREPYPLREYHAGVQSYNQHAYQDAVGHFDHALATDPQNVRLLFARGQAWQQQGNFDFATRDYQAAAAKSSAGIIRACLAYCFAMRKKHQDAVDWGRRAIESGLRTADVYNNLGHSFLEQGALGFAQENLDTAIRLDDGLQAAYYNRAMVVARQVVKMNRSPDSAIADIERAIEIGPPSAEIYFDAAYLQAAADAEPSRGKRVVVNLCQALEEGLPPERIRSEPKFVNYLHEPAVKKLLDAGPTPRRHPPAALLIAPVCPPWEALPFDN